VVRGKLPLYLRLDQHGLEAERLRERLQAGDLAAVQRLRRSNGWLTP